MSETLKELDDLCDSLVDMKAVKDAQKDELAKTDKKLKEIEMKIVEVLEKHEKTEYSTPHGRFSIKGRTYYKMVDKDEAMQWLKDNGKFDDLASVNANTFSSYVNGVIEEKRNDGDFAFMPPGVEDTSSTYKGIKLLKR